MKAYVLAGACVAALMMTSAAAKDTDAAEDGARSQQIVCKRAEPATGTRLRGEAVCKTKQQWELERREAQAQIRDASTRANQMDSTPGG